VVCSTSIRNPVRTNSTAAPTSTSSDKGCLRGALTLTTARANTSSRSAGNTISLQRRRPGIPGQVIRCRDKTFFFVNFEMYREASEQSGNLRNCATLAMRTGISARSWARRYSTRTRSGVRSWRTHSTIRPTTRVVGSSTVRDVFAGNKIPSSSSTPSRLRSRP